MKLNNGSGTAGSRRNRAFAKTGKIRCRKKRLISALLSTTLFAAATLAGVPLTDKTAYAATEKTKDNTTLGAGVLETGVNTTAAKTVYYGNGREWRVIGYDGTGAAAASGCLTLFASNNLATTQFNPSNGNNHYKDSTLQGTITGIYNDFADKEKSNDVLTARILEGGSENYGNRTYDSNKIAGSAVSDAPLWPLSCGEANSLNANLSRANGDWWLRSPGEYGYQAARVYSNGVVSERGTNLAYNDWARPAFYLKLSSIIFTSKITDDKYKLTVKDTSLKASAKSDKNLSSAAAGDNVKISYSGVAGSPNRLSVLMTDKAWDDSGARVKYYGKLDISGTIGTSGTVDFTLPADFDSSWKVYIVPEQTNDDDTKTDYAGNPSLITLYAKRDKNDDADDDDDDDHEEHKPASWELNPNEKQQLSIVWKGTGTGISAGYQEQGDIAKGVIKKAVPVGYKEAFSFDLLVNGKMDKSLKSGTMTLDIPAEYLKTTVSAGQLGRQYAIIALDRYGKTYLLTDSDTNPNTVTVNVYFEGFAMELIYTG